jgi:hypothetical protein
MATTGARLAEGDSVAPATTCADGRFKLAFSPNVATAHPTVEVHNQGNASLRPGLGEHRALT